MDEYIDMFSKRLASMSPGALLELKKVIWRGTEDWAQLLEDRATISGRLVLSDFTKNAIAAIKAKNQ